MSETVIELVGYEADSGVAVVAIEGRLQVLVPPYSNPPLAVEPDEHVRLHEALDLTPASLTFSEMDGVVQYLRGRIRLDSSLAGRDLTAKALYSSAARDLDLDEIEHLVDAVAQVGDEWAAFALLAGLHSAERSGLEPKVRKKIIAVAQLVADRALEWARAVDAEPEPEPSNDWVAPSVFFGTEAA